MREIKFMRDKDQIEKIKKYFYERDKIYERQRSNRKN